MNINTLAHNIGDYVPMIDGPEKVSGRAKYTADIVAPGQLAGHIYRSPYAQAEIVSVDVSEALKIPGVKAIVTGATKGIGRAIAETLLAEGASVAICARNADGVEAAVGEMSSLGTVYGAAVDAGDGHALSGWVATARKKPS